MAIEGVVALAWCTTPLRDAAGPVLAGGANLRHRPDEDGRRATSGVRAAFRAAHGCMTSASQHKTLTELAAHTDREQQ